MDYKQTDEEIFRVMNEHIKNQDVAVHHTGSKYAYDIFNTNTCEEDNVFIIDAHMILKILSYIFGMTLWIWVGVILCIISEYRTVNVIGWGMWLKMLCMMGPMMGALTMPVTGPLGIVIGCIIIPRIIDFIFLSDDEFLHTEKDREQIEKAALLAAGKSYYDCKKIMKEPLFKD